MISFGQRLKLIRKEAGITQSELAEQLTVSVQAVSKWECDNTMPDISQIVPLAAILGVTTDYLLGVGTDEKKDRFELEETIGKINYTYINLTYENNRAFKQYEQYHEYLKKYPLDYEVKLRCASSIYDFIYFSRSGTMYNISAEERARLFSEGIRILDSVVNQDKDLTRKIRAGEALVQLYVQNGDLEKAEETSKLLPEHGNVKTEALISVYDARGDYEKCLELSRTMESSAASIYLHALMTKARRISIFGDVRKKEAIAAWLVYEEAARYNHKLLRNNPLDANDTMWHVYCAIWSRANDCIAISDIDGALSAVEDMRDFGIEYYKFRKEKGADRVELDGIIAWLQNSIKRCYMHSLGTPDNILDNHPRFKACQDEVCKLD